MKQKIWRYTNYQNGGVVFAETKEEALEKLKGRYGNDDFEVWLYEEDDHYDADHPDVIDCYG